MKGALQSILIIFVSFLQVEKARSQTINKILDQVNRAVLDLKEEQFTFHDKLTKLVSDGDSSQVEHNSRCFFKRNPTDSLIGFQIASIREDGYQQVYDSIHLFTVYEQILEVTPKQMYPGQVEQLLAGPTGPTFIATTNRFLQYFNKPSAPPSLQLVGLMHFMGQECYQIRLVNSHNPVRQSEINYYISTHSFLPLRTITKLTAMVGKAKEIQVFDYWITDLTAKLSAGNLFSRDQLTNYRIEKQYDPAEEQSSNKLLPLGSIAPT